MQRKDGMFYAPTGKPNPVVEAGEFRFAAIGLDHGHIYGMCNGLIEAGAELAWVSDPDPARVARFQASFPQVQIAPSEESVLADPDIRLVACASVPADRCGVGLRVMDAGKDFFVDKPPLTTGEQLAAARAATAETGRKYAVYYSERLHVESALFAGDLILEGAIGRVIQVVNLAPHRANLASRPDWFFDPERYGGILCDLGSHQIEQFLFYAGARDATVLHSKIANYHHPQYPGFEDFGDATLLADNGATMYFRVDWFTPDGLPVWGDGRTFIVGTDGTIELRKYIDVARDSSSDHLYLVNQEGEQHLALHGQVGFPFFGQLILDCLNRTENAQTQAHAFKTIELAIQAQEMAQRVA
ncbi:MAG: Gfo/Idh/MocA family oxidoreductase [Chloroflexota bacterium]|nr:Gfo/Idh/MocA family oxidoreductase [Chloroflexota bacterium]